MLEPVTNPSNLRAALYAALQRMARETADRQYEERKLALLLATA